jgi:positive regulator of sigma E activity
MEEIGVVKKLISDLAEIEIDASNMCGTCANKSACHLVEGGEKRRLVVRNTAGAQVGDLVRVELEPRQAIFSAFMIFIFPVLLLGAGYFVGATFSEGWGVIGAVAGLILGFGITRLVDSVIKRKDRFQPYISEILETCPQPEIGRA